MLYELSKIVRQNIPFSFVCRLQDKIDNTRNNATTNTNKPHIVVPYIKGLSESCKNICRKCGIQMYFKGGRTIKALLVKPKERDTIWQKSGVIHRYRCGRDDYEEEKTGSQTEHLQKDTKNTWEPHFLSMTIITTLVMIYLLTTSALWTEKIKIWQDPSKKPFLSELLTHPIIEI